MSGYQGTPDYPSPPAIASHGLNSFDQDDPPAIDPNLINPPGTAPEGTPGALSSPGEGSAFVLPDPIENKPKKKGLKKLGGLGDSFRGGFSKVKGKLKKQPKIKEAYSIEMPSDEDLAGSREYLDEEKPPYPDVYETKPGETSKQPSRLDALGTSLRNLVKKPQNADPTPYKSGDVIELKEVESKKYITFGNFINVMLICFIIAGIIMCACINVDHDLYYIGPAALGLGCFALVGKLFFTIFWQEDPVPQSLKPSMAKMENVFEPIRGHKDPYGLQSGEAYGGPVVMTRTVYLGPMSTSSAPNVVQMEPFTYPRMGEPKMYDESIDMRLRAMNERTTPYSDQAYTDPSGYHSTHSAVKAPW